MTAVEDAYPASAWKNRETSWPAIRGVDKRHVAAFLEDYVPFISDVLFADNALSSYIKTSKSPAIQLWTVAFAQGSGHAEVVAGGLRVRRPRRAVKVGKSVGPAGSERAPFKVSGSSSRLAGSADIAHIFGIKDKEASHEPDVYQKIMGRGPALMIYLIEPTVDGEAIDNRSIALRESAMGDTKRQPTRGPSDPKADETDVRELWSTVGTAALGT